LPAGTDGRIMTELCPCVLRFAPLRLNAQQLASVHGENENIDITAIGTAVMFYRRLLGKLGEWEELVKEDIDAELEEEDIFWEDTEEDADGSVAVPEEQTEPQEETEQPQEMQYLWDIR